MPSRSSPGPASRGDRELAPEPPEVLVGGNSDIAIRRAVEHGAGWLPFADQSRTTVPRDEAEKVPMPADSPAGIAEHFAAYAAAGAERVGTSPQATDEATWLRQCEVIAAAAEIS
ncbi:MAG: hypothetical protein GEV28_36295 [Actinophytocola sp.]|uniref:hypothetical protein n=1 Tax=Actinophytocola sp. TaxID=1872138 RepID=UPI00132752C0|nr:hypothetical protein [Actinophytocola sp.]MPZ85551.1 hypothetical protein [Actinophytocola sp.]